MSVCKKHFSCPRIRRKVVETYRSTLKTMAQVAEVCGVTHHTVIAILADCIEPDELAKLKAVKYSESKRGEKNPMLGKVPKNHKGECKDGYGYLTRVVRGKRQFVHRIVMAELLGIPVEELPSGLTIHHIDGDRENNHPDNLALTTKVGHVAIHQRYQHTPEESRLRGLSLSEAIRYMTSK
jgi:hypothetical protein